MRRPVEDVLKDLREQAQTIDRNATAYYLCGQYEVKTIYGGWTSDDVQWIRRQLKKAIKEAGI